MPEPSMSDLARMGEDTLRAIRDLTAEMRADRLANATTYLRGDLYNVAHKALEDDVRDLKDRLDKAEAFKRQIIAGVSVGLIMLLVSLFMSIGNFMARGGA